MKIGMLHSRSGVAGMWAPSGDATALVGAAEINASGGILGEPVELVFGHFGFSVSDALDTVDMMVDMEGVDAVIGAHASNIRDAVSERLAGRVPYIYATHYEGVDCGLSTIAIGDTDNELMAPSVQWLRSEKKAERFFFVGSDFNWPHATLVTTRKILKKQGANLVGHGFLPMEEADYSELLQRIERSGAQVVIQALLGSNSVEFNRAFAAAGLDGKILRFGLVMDEIVLCGIGAESSANLYTASSFFAGHHSHYNEHFLEIYHDAFGELAPPVSAATLGCYNGLHFIRDLASNLKTRNSRQIAHHLQQHESRASYGKAYSRRIGSVPQISPIYLGEAEGVTLKVISALT